MIRHSAAALIALGAAIAPRFAGAQPAPLLGFEQNVPLDRALHDIIPRTTSWYWMPGPDRQQRVSWQGGAPWRQILSRLLAAHGLAASSEPSGAIAISFALRRAPLREALGSIVPERVSWRLAPGLDPGTTLTWTPGPLWKDVLAAALSKAHLAARWENGAFTVVPSESATPLKKVLETRERNAAHTRIAERVNPHTPVTRKSLAPAPIELHQAPAAAAKILKSLETANLAQFLARTLPPQYHYTLGPSLNPATAITWRPQSGWRATLARALEKNGLAASWSPGAITIGLAPDTASLAEALPRILPAGYTWSLASGISPATLVTWPAGLPWQTALQEALGKAGLAVTAAGPRSVRIGREVPGLPPAQSAAAPAPGWTVRQGETLRSVLERWAFKTARTGKGWHVHWQARTNYPIEAGARFNGDFRTAVRRLFDALAAARPAPHAAIHDGNRQIVVTTDSEND